MKKVIFTFILLIICSQYVFADGFGWHFSTLSDYSKFVEFFNDGKPKPFNSSDLDEYYFWYEDGKVRAKQENLNKNVIDHLLSGKINYSSLSFDESQALDVFIRYYVFETSSYDSLQTEGGIDSIRTWCFGEYLDLNPQNSLATKFFASGRRINTNGPVQCKENTNNLEDALSRLSNNQKLSEEQLEKIRQIDERSNKSAETCYNSYFALSPGEVGILIEELKPVMTDSKFYEEDCPLNELYEYLQITNGQKKGIFAWTTD